MPQQQVVRHHEIEIDLKRLGKRFRSVRKNLQQAERLLAAGLPLNQSYLFPGFGDLKIWKGRVLNTDINKGLSSGYRLIWHERDNYVLMVVHIYDKADYNSEQTVINEIKARLNS